MSADELVAETRRLLAAATPPALNSDTGGSWRDHDDWSLPPAAAHAALAAAAPRLLAALCDEVERRSGAYTPDEMDRLMAAVYPTRIEKVIEVVASRLTDLVVSMQRRRVQAHTPQHRKRAS